MAEMRRFSTKDIAGSDRLAIWNEASENAIGAMILDADREIFEATLTRLKTETLEIVSIVSAPVIVRNTWQSRHSSPCFLLQLVHTGQCDLLHNGSNRTLFAGDLLIVDVSREYELTSRQVVHGLTIRLPWERFGQYAERLERFSRCGLDMACGSAAALATFLRWAWDCLAADGGHNWPDSAEQVIWDLLEAAVAEEAYGGAKCGRADRLRHAAKAHIAANLFDPDFSVSEISKALGVSARYLQAAFAEVGTTPSLYLRSRRLEAAAEILRRNPTGETITEVALVCGFNDLSHFSRSFRTLYEVSPRTFRGRTAPSVSNASSNG